MLVFVVSVGISQKKCCEHISVLFLQKK